MLHTWKICIVDADTVFGSSLGASPRSALFPCLRCPLERWATDGGRAFVRRCSSGSRERQKRAAAVPGCWLLRLCRCVDAMRGRRPTAGERRGSAVGGWMSHGPTRLTRVASFVWAGPILNVGVRSCPGGPILNVGLGVPWCTVTGSSKNC